MQIKVIHYPKYDVKYCNMVTPFKFAAVKVRGFDIIPYSLPFNLSKLFHGFLLTSGPV